MKKITLIVPDEVTHICGDRTVFESTMMVTPEVVKKLLSKRDDYHEDFYFKESCCVKINIEDCANPE